MSAAIVCGKRSFFDDTSPTSSSPVSKKLRCSPVRRPAVDHLRSLFPNLDKQVLEKALDDNGNDLDFAIKSLKQLCFTNVDGNSGSVTFSNAATSEEDATLKNSSAHANSPRSGAQWVDLFVAEIMSATSVDDARSRAMRMLEELEKSIRVTSGADAVQSLHKEYVALKEQTEVFQRENTILKRAVAIQHERQKDYDDSTREVQHLKQLVSMYQEQLRTLEVNNYALTMHLKQAQESSSMPGRFHPDVF
uniref:uncharacterized protein LOC122588787 n=1 Tax=Erigeron canadensis TaxID=72917 RepID=UPI001CB8DA0B|nr:uncharacterized protein LOC122588787 [Erigeron canadensis]